MTIVIAHQLSQVLSPVQHDSLCFLIASQVSSQSKVSSGGQNLQLLSRIVEQIEQNPLSVTGRNTQVSSELFVTSLPSCSLFDVPR